MWSQQSKNNLFTKKSSLLEFDTILLLFGEVFMFILSLNIENESKNNVGREKKSRLLEFEDTVKNMLTHC